MTRGTGSEVRRFEASPAEARDARRFVAAALERCGWGEVADDAQLCASELASNAILHSRAGFTVSVDATPELVRLEVRDSRPADLPFALPLLGAGREVIDGALTGRGLRIVATLGKRWGFTTLPDMKVVWVEFGDAGGTGDGAAVVELGHASPSTSPGDTTLHMLNLPVLPAIGSGLQVDGLVREIQLGLFDGAIDESERARFYDLLDKSAPARLSGRYAALAAAATGQRRFDLDVIVSPGMVEAVAALGNLLAELPQKQPLTTASPPPEVVAFRAWLEEEVGRQLTGAEPRVCPLPD